MTKPVDLSPQALAEACAQAMWDGDLASKALGMNVEEVAPGRAVLSMTIREDMANGHGIGHGGFTFTLADSAFAYACNSHNELSVAQHCNVTFLAPTRVGEKLIATASERHREGRSGIYDITVEAEDGRRVAEFRGWSRSIKGTWLPDDGAGAD